MDILLNEGINPPRKFPKFTEALFAIYGAVERLGRCLSGTRGY